MRASVLTTVLLAACAPAAYVVPPGGETASLRIENQSPPVFGYELEAGAYQDAASCTGKLLVASTRDLPHGVARTVQVASGAPFTLVLRGSGGGASRSDACVLAGTFTPATDRHYVALFRVPEGKCELLLLQQSPPGSARRYLIEPTYRERREAACLGASAPSSIPAPAGVPPPPPGSAAPPVPPLPRR